MISAIIVLIRLMFMYLYCLFVCVFILVFVKPILCIFLSVLTGALGRAVLDTERATLVK